MLIRRNYFYKNRFLSFSRQRGRMSKGVVFTTTLIEWSGFNPHPGHVVASLDKTLYDDYLCLVASNKYQIQWTKIRRNPHDHRKRPSWCGFLQSRSSRSNEKCTVRRISYCLTLSGDSRINMRYNNNNNIILVRTFTLSPWRSLS